MKKLFVILFMLFSVNLLTNAQTVAENGPEITFEKTTHQFGEIPFNGNGTYL